MRKFIFFIIRVLFMSLALFSISLGWHHSIQQLLILLGFLSWGLTGYIEGLLDAE